MIKPTITRTDSRGRRIFYAIWDAVITVLGIAILAMGWAAMIQMLIQGER